MDKYTLRVNQNGDSTVHTIEWKRDNLEDIRNKPVVHLTPEEMEHLSDDERRWVIAFLAKPPVKWPYE